MAKHGELYLCIVCNILVEPVYRWAVAQVAVSCPECGRRFRLVKPTPAVLAAVGPKPAKAETGNLFTEEGS
jgi:DNA-directed RNA polymerase subunit RPC12/RpoP